MERVIAVANQKGGVGKTTTTVNLAASLAAIKKRVLVVDFDPQGNATSGLNIPKIDEKPNIYHVLAGSCEIKDAMQQAELPTLFAIPGHRDLAAAEVELVNEMGREYILKNLLEGVRDQFDYIFIDCPPSLSLLTINALAAADGVLIPIQAEYYALEGVRDLIDTIQLVQRRINRELVVSGVVVTMFDERTNLSNQVFQDVQGYFGEKLYKTIIPRNVRLSEAPSFGKPVMLYDIKSKGAQAYLNLAKEFLNGQKARARQGA
ncbi:MAG: ParA family protein [Acidobacteria bacterium]|nr:ParA family protein [Acidobacteriota bacterium]MCB9396271.1 ParA family protein [Acidobacteriota bacterium]